jgi:hypothetical protein
MSLGFGLIALSAVLPLAAQMSTESNKAYQHFQAVRGTPEGANAAAAWLQIYERQQPNTKNIPPYLTVARLYADRGVHLDEVPDLLEKADREMATPGSFSDIHIHSNWPFGDDIARSLAAAVYTKIHLYDKAHKLLDTVTQTVTATKPEGLDSSIALSFWGLLFNYRDAMARLAIAEGRKEDALSVEQSILTNPKAIAPHLIEEHRALALALWTDLGRSADTFDAWVSAGH